ncbi:Transient receptor ion channel domain-containing protein [Caenorhabditis elegans]|uniref:TRP homologous cation channel protein n=2 Tax=Caenorhabditis elegans TaxID=6239 RepID=G5EF09_CAEEL|nr:Transient receptor ion channel domain-containing protein [Caenorhabditis elegans]AAQ22724.1 TRP-3 channel protein [Caenorhabditis elegans]CAA91343.1 Transient receptor ion channel domain-containing protein [Caenorhabditis elegans]CAC81656.1 TRP homologous cation channel protein [Caenorhabditis elegans]|eukprot:NP_001254872.1 Uncharacterized protein CELE_K01A11.4 [Caenorhabditis elegans]
MVGKEKKESTRLKLSAIKEYLGKYRGVDADNNEGYDGHQKWHENDQVVLQAMAYFYKAVKSKLYSEVRSFLGILLPHGPDDGRLSSLQSLLMDTSSEESLKEALLLSIAVGSRPLVEFVLVLFVDAPYLERSGSANSPHFPPHMTPLMLACILNNFSIVQCLITRGHCIQIPHFITCECKTCKRETVTTHSSTRLVDVMRALSSEAYLWLATDDVFAATCAVARDLQQLASDDQLEYVETYRDLEMNVQRFLCRISDQAWRVDEFNMMVANRNYCPERMTEISSPRLQMAMDSQMRQFTCSTNSQTTIKSVFRSDWYNYGIKPKRDAWRFLRACILMPFLVMLHAFMPTKGTTMCVPLARFIAHITMYLVFLIAAILRPTIGFYFAWTDSIEVTVQALEIFMYAYVMGLALEKGILFYRVGRDGFFAFWWRWFDAALIFIFLFSLIFFTGKWGKREAFDPSSVDRMHWPSFEFSLLHEICLAIACVLSILKCFYYAQMMKSIGGSVISVGKCVGKTYTYILIMVAIIVSFSVGLNIIVDPYLNRSTMKIGDQDYTKTTDSYETIGTSSKNLFWSIFGYLGPSTFTTVVGNTGPNMDPVKHTLNSSTFEILAAVYHGILIITVLNLMTSILVKGADEVLDNEEMEFKFTRAAIYSEFLSWEMAAPPPLNLILVVAHFVHRNLLKRYYASPAWGEKPANDDVEDQAADEQYMQLLMVVFARFVASKECKYKSIWRSEFHREEKQPPRVTFLTTGAHSFLMDNTFEGFKMRSSRTMEAEGYKEYTTVQYYVPKSKTPGPAAAADAGTKVAPKDDKPQNNPVLARTGIDSPVPSSKQVMSSELSASIPRARDVTFLGV